jgi:hypothetical protein
VCVGQGRGVSGSEVRCGDVYLVVLDREVLARPLQVRHLHHQHIPPLLDPSLGPNRQDTPQHYQLD